MLALQEPPQKAETDRGPVNFRTVKTEGIDVGEVRAVVKLTSVEDQGQAQGGFIPNSEVRSVEVDAMMDSGSVRTVVSRDVARRLGLRHMFDHRVVLADGTTKAVPVYSPILIEVHGCTQVELPAIGGEETLLGQTVFEQTGLLIDCKNQTLAPPPADWAPRL